MITPTGITSEAYWAAIKNGNQTHARMTFTAQNIVLTDDDISISSGITITDILNGDTDLVFGKAVSKQLTTTIINSDNIAGLSWTGEFTLEMGVDISGTTYWVTVGIFSGEKPNNVTTKEEIEFTAYDRMKLFDKLADDYVKNLEYPLTVQDLYDGICEYVGLQNVSGDELSAIMNRSFASAPVVMEGYTCRDILSWIAEACGCYASINPSGNVVMKWFTDNSGHVVTGNEEFRVETDDIKPGLIWNEADMLTWNEIDEMTWNDVCGFREAYSIDRIMVKQLDTNFSVTYPSYLTDGNAYMIVDNPFLPVGSWDDMYTYILPIYNRLITFGGYLPVNLDCIGNWCVEAGDIITIDVGEYTFEVPIFAKTMRWDGSTNDVYETTGQKTRNAYTNETNRQQILNSREIKMLVEGHYYGVQSGIVIDEYGVTISGNKYINIESGSGIDNLGNINIKSGGNVNVASGGNVNMESGSDINIKSGADMNIESGGNLNVASGGNIDIRGSGTLALTGSDVSIKSGSTFDVEATNFKIDSTNKKVETGEWTLEPRGLTANLYYSSTNYLLAFGRTGIAYPTDKPFIGILPSIGGYLGSKYSGSFQFRVVQSGASESAGLTIDVMTGLNPPRVVIGTSLISGGYSLALLGILGSSTKKWRVYGEEVYYDSLIQNSSRDIKHDIQDMPSVGDKLDKLKPVTFVYDEDRDENKRMGLIYEDTIQVMPEICTCDESNKAISYIELIPALLKEIQDLRARVKQLEERGK